MERAYSLPCIEWSPFFQPPCLKLREFGPFEMAAAVVLLEGRKTIAQPKISRKLMVHPNTVQ